KRKTEPDTDDLRPRAADARALLIEDRQPIHPRRGRLSHESSPHVAHRPGSQTAREEIPAMLASTLSMLAQTATPLIGDKGLAIFGAAFGAGVVTLGAAKGIGHLAGQAMEGIARQPEAGGRIGTNM